MSKIKVKLKDPTSSLVCYDNGVIIHNKGVYEVEGDAKRIREGIKNGRLVVVVDEPTAAEIAAKKAEAEAAAKVEAEAKAKSEADAKAEAEAQKAAEAAAKKAEAEAAKTKKEADAKTPEKEA